MEKQSYLIDRYPAKLTDNGLAFLALDVRWLISYVASLKNERLNDVFAELSQVS